MLATLFLLDVPLHANAKDLLIGGAPMYSSKNIVENTLDSSAHTTLVAAVRAAGLAETLQGKGPFTIFAPTDAAFGKLPSGTIEGLLRPENKALLTKILTCHVVSGEEFTKTIAEMIKADNGEYDLQTVGGCVLQAKLSDGQVTLTSSGGTVAHVTAADLKQSNGVIQVIDNVLIPSEDPQVHA
ncbi:fasciclin domain-containing protein [Rhizobium ruizarguesonis]